MTFQQNKKMYGKLVNTSQTNISMCRSVEKYFKLFHALKNTFQNEIKKLQFYYYNIRIHYAKMTLLIYQKNYNQEILSPKCVWKFLYTYYLCTYFNIATD